MSGETEASVSGWTTDTLHQHLSQRITDQDRLFSRRMDDADKAIQAALVSAEKARGEAQAANEKRFASVNEFRGQQADLIATFLPRPEYMTAHEALVDRVSALTDRLTALELRLTSRLDLNQGSDTGATGQRAEQRAGQTLSLNVIGAVVAVLVLVIGLYATFHK